MTFATETVVVLADGLTDPERKEVCLVMLEALLRQRLERNTSVEFDAEELGRSAEHIIGQLAESGLPDKKHVPTILRCANIIDALGDVMPQEIIADSVKVRDRLLARCPFRLALERFPDPFPVRLEQMARKGTAL